MPTGTPAYPTSIDTDATLGPTSSIVPGTGGTVLGGAASGQGTILGITKNLINTLIGLETVVGIPSSGVSTTLSFKVATLQSQIVALPTTSLTGVVPPLPSTAAGTKFLRGDATFAAIPPAITGVAGLVPLPPGTTTTFLRDDATWTTPLSTKTYAVFTAMDASPPSTLYAVFGTRNAIPYLAFNDTTSWNTVFMAVVPEAAVLTSGLKVRIHWISASATTGNVMWRQYFERMNTNENSDSFDTVTSAAAAACNGTSGIITITETICTTIDSMTIGDGFRLKIDRDAANVADTMAGDAQILLIEVRSAV